MFKYKEVVLYRTTSLYLKILLKAKTGTNFKKPLIEIFQDNNSH